MKSRESCAKRAELRNKKENPVPRGLNKGIKKRILFLEG
jgi:hypothetical protein